jgi:hypothetical protein
VPPDLDRLRIQRSETQYQSKTFSRGRILLALGGAILLILLALYLGDRSVPPRK